MACIQHNESYHGGQAFCGSYAFKHKRIWLVALLVSLSLHASLLWQRGGQIGTQHPQHSATPIVTWLQVQEPTKVQTKSQPPQASKTRRLQHKPSPHQVTHQVKPKTKNTSKLSSAKVRKTHTKQSAASAQTSHTPAMQQGMIQQQEQQYLALVMQRIEQHKRYPKAAQRRGIQGAISVLFFIHADGSIHDVQLEQGASMLQRAVRKALTQAAPLPLPPPSLSFPITGHFTMQFYLQP